MLEFDKRLNLIKQAKYKYSLQNVAEPNLYREIYDYKHIPKIAFNMRHVPEDMPDEIWITDTTFRDGQQSAQPLYPGTDRAPVQAHAAASAAPRAWSGRASSSFIPIRTRKPLRRLPGPGPALPGDHHLDSRQ